MLETLPNTKVIFIVRNPIGEQKQKQKYFFLTVHFFKRGSYQTWFIIRAVQKEKGSQFMSIS